MVKYLGLLLTVLPVYAQNNALEKLREAVGDMFSSSFTANFTVTNPQGQTVSGKIYYQAPNKLHLRTSEGGIIATNGTHLWIYNPAVSVCAKQEVSQNSGGILSWLSSYEGIAKGDGFIFRKNGAYYEEVFISTAGGKLTSIRLRHQDEFTTYTFSNIEIGTGLKASLFNYKPPAHVQIVENPIIP